MESDVSSAAIWKDLLGPDSYSAGLDSERVLSLVRLLNERGDPEVIAWALPMLSDKDSWRRSVAAQVVGQHGFRRGRPYGPRVQPSVVAAARVEQVDEARAAMVEAIGDSEDPSWADELMRYAADPSPKVRLAVAANLPMIFGGDDLTDLAMQALITLSADSDPHVRDWATFGIGQRLEHDTDAVNDALRQRLDDTDDDDSDTSLEAALGLALRGDRTVYPYLEESLSAQPAHVSRLSVEAAGALGDSRLLPALCRLWDAGWHVTDRDAEVLADAITALQNRPD